MTPGEIFWVELPKGAGHAQTGKRPAIVLQGKEANDKLPTVIVVPFTTRQDALRFPGTVLIKATKNNGLRQPSVAMVFQLSVLDKSFLGSKVGKLSQTDIDAIWEAFDLLMERSTKR